MCFLLNTVPLVTTSLGHNGRTGEQYMADLMTCYFTVLHVGITIPLLLTIIANIYLSCKLKNMSTPNRDSKRSSKEMKNSRTFQKFLNGLVIWLVICNAPYIAWYIWSLTLYANNGGKAWAGVEGVSIEIIDTSPNEYVRINSIIQRKINFIAEANKVILIFCILL